MRRGVYVAVPGIIVLTAVLAFVRTTRLSSEEPVDPRGPIEGTSSDLVQVRRNEAAGTMDVIIGPVHLPAHNPGHRAPIQLVQIPGTGWLHGFSWFVHDAGGRRISNEMLHHVNLIDPDRRELFAPVARRVVAMGRETDGQALPRALGYPLHENTRFLVVTMFSNPTPRDEDIFLTIRLQHSPEKWLQPLPIFPFHMDVMGPVGEKDFAVPPGYTAQGWEGSPAVDARILGLGGHLHDYATLLKLEDLTSGKVLWRATPERTGARVTGVPRTMPWKRGGIRLHRDHRYRVVVEYENPGMQPTPHGGMGVLGGIVLSTQPWPALDRTNADYVADLANVLSAPARQQTGHGMHH